MLDIIRSHILPAALSLLPAKMDSPMARRMTLAIGLQESRFETRRQVGGGPGRGLWQFERDGGVTGVLTHAATKDYIRGALGALNYDNQTAPTSAGAQRAAVERHVAASYVALEHNDVLACVYARLLLWSLPYPLPADEAGGWKQYLETWRPGKPHLGTWAESWQRAGDAGPSR